MFPPLSVADLAYPAAVILVAYLALGITGFASSLIGVPLLVWHWPLDQVVALMLMMDLSASLLMGGLNFREVRWRELRQLAAGLALGALAGLYLASAVRSTLPLVVLGGYVGWVGVQALRSSAARPRAAAPGWQGHVFGLAIGVVEVMFATSGPLVLAWLARRRVDARGMRASVPAFAIWMIAAVLALFAANGRLSTPVVWQRYGVLLPVALLAVVGGHLIAHRLPVDVLRRAISSLLVLSGAALALNGLRGLF